MEKDSSFKDLFYSLCEMFGESRSVLMAKFSARNNFCAARQERSSKSAAAYSSLHYALLYRLDTRII